MTVEVKAKPCRLSAYNDIQLYCDETMLYQYHSSVTERRQDGGNDIYATEDVSMFNHRTSLSIHNDKFDVYITHKSYEMLARELLERTDLLVDAVGWLTEFGFDIKMPERKNPDNRVFRKYISGLDRGARRRWEELYVNKQTQEED